jgi:hypothetical protein
MWSIPVDRISTDAIGQTRQKLDAWRLADPARRAYLSYVTFDNLKDRGEVDYFRRVKTSLALPKDQVDKLREIGGRLLRESPGFQKLVADLGR